MTHTMTRTSMMLLVVCLMIAVPMAATPVATAEPAAMGHYCVDLKPDEPTDPIDVYECPHAGEP